MLFIGCVWLFPRMPGSSEPDIVSDPFSISYLAMTLVVLLVVSAIIGWQVGIRQVNPLQRHYSRAKAWMFSLTFGTLAIFLQSGLCFGALIAVLIVIVFKDGLRIR